MTQAKSRRLSLLFEVNWVVVTEKAGDLGKEKRHPEVPFLAFYLNRIDRSTARTCLVRAPTEM